MLDGVNSLSDLVSAVFSVIGVRLGMKSADSHHPFGCGRVEYVSSLLITMLILYVGVQRVHSFSVDFRNHEISFSVVARQGSADESGDLDRLRRELEKLYPEMKITIDVSPERIGE